MYSGMTQIARDGIEWRKIFADTLVKIDPKARKSLNELRQLSARIKKRRSKSGAGISWQLAAVRAWMTT
jgi:hypothetical protein